MENSTDGRVSDTLDCFSRSHVRICGELPLRIHHCLLGIGRATTCKTFTASRSRFRNAATGWRGIFPTPIFTKWAAPPMPPKRRAANLTRPRSPAARPELHYDLPAIVENVEDNPDNITRFAIISSEPGPPTGNDKTSLMMEIAHEPGALADAMAIFKKNRLNMTWIESFPIPGSRGRYLFFVEFVGHEAEPPARRAIAALSKKCATTRSAWLLCADRAGRVD